MTAAYTNRANLPLMLAGWLTYDTYDHDPRPNHISATSLLKPTRQLILTTRLVESQKIRDVADLVASRIGSAVHDSIEQAWTHHHKEMMANLGYPPRVIDAVRVNPKPEELTPDIYPLYLEQRVEKECNGFIISGKFDAVFEGMVIDHKVTKTYAYTMGNKDGDYAKQGSIYRWLNPDLITANEMMIQFLFSDWQASGVIRSKEYPPTAALGKKFPLESEFEVERFVRDKTNEIKTYLHSPEPDIIPCNDKELWRKPDTWKYYKKPGAVRATKNYDNPHEAHARANMEGGEVIHVPGEVTACKYCDAFPICSQKDRYIASGELKL